MIGKDANLDVRLGIEGDTLLNILVMLTDSDSITCVVDTIKMFTEQGLSINIQNTTGTSLLHYIVKNSLMMGDNCADHLIREVIKLGADVNLRDMCGRNVIHEIRNILTPGSVYAETLVTLLKCGVDINSADYNGCTTLMDETRFNRKVNNIKELIKHGAQVNAVDKCGRTVLHHFISTMSLQKVKNGTISNIFEMLVDSKVKLDTKDKFKRNAFHYIKYIGRRQTLRDHNFFISDYPDGHDLEGNSIREIKNYLEELEQLYLIDQDSDDVWISYLKLDKKLDFKFKESRNAFKTVTQDDARTNIMLTQDDLLAVQDVQDILKTPGIGKVGHVDAFKPVSLQVDLIIKKIAEKLNTQQSEFKYEVQLSCGISEGTKVGKPDEFDYLIFVHGLIDKCIL